MSDREFRTEESYEAERTTREMIPEFLRRRGFYDVRDDRKKFGMTESQTIHAISPNKQQLAMRIKLCWRRTDTGSTRSATQLMAKVKDGDWEGSLQRFVKHAETEGISHFLFARREGEEVTAAALVPCSDLLDIWCAQRDIGEALIAEGRLGRRKKNHAMNGSSPTLWLEDDTAPTVEAALWGHRNVKNLVEMEEVNLSGEINQQVDDTFDDMPGLDYSLIGSDGMKRSVVARSHVKRDPRVRLAVLDRAGGRYEREGCGAARVYSGFLDVHHVLGVEKGDRVWNCVAVCPNCHRETHVSPERDQINAALLSLAMTVDDTK
jgi:5-methylcytosine-specific restriction protein A